MAAATTARRRRVNAFDWGDVKKGFEGMERAGRDLSAAWKELRGPVRDDQREHQKLQSGPDGRWPARSRKTLAKLAARRRGTTKKGRRRSRRRVGPLLGRLPGLLRFEVSRYGLVVSSLVPWADIHQDGGRTGKGGRAVIPARPFLWISDRLTLAVKETLIDHIFNGWRATSVWRRLTTRRR